MRKTNYESDVKPILVNTKGLQDLCQCGRPTAIKIANNAKAVVRFGKRLLFNVNKIQEYIDSISGSDSNIEEDE